MVEKDVFILTTNHLKLLQKMIVEWYDEAYLGAPTIDIKRPYGNSDVLIDVAEIIGLEFTEEKEKYLLMLHRETEDALQIVLSTGQFIPGKYEKDHYGYDWKLVTEAGQEEQSSCDA